MGVKQEELNMGNNENVTPNDNSQQTENVTPQVGATSQNSDHMFTQEQLNSIISGRINALNQKVGELSTALEKSNKLTEQYHAELEGYKRKEIALKEGISADLVDYAIFGANKLVSKDKSFEDALKEFKASNATLFGVTQQAGGSENGSGKIKLYSFSSGQYKYIQDIIIEYNNDIYVISPVKNIVWYEKEDYLFIQYDNGEVGVFNF
jgi:hypothetical protein